MRLRSSHLFLLLGIVLMAIAFVARSGLFTRLNPGEPANKYMRAALAASKIPQLSTEEAAVIAEKYNTATVKSSGLRYLIQAPGMGEAKPRIGQQVTVNYVGRLLRDGTKFDSSYDHGQPFTFQVGLGQVIPGWDATLLDMKKGEQRTVIVPWWLAYGERGYPPLISPKTSLVFEIKLLDFH
jgi:FKBP-type peptidyl-prolyl cis-trans isomerase